MRACACFTVLPASSRVRSRAGVGRAQSGGVGHEAAVAADDVAGRQLQLAPPHDVGGVAERADHRDAGPLLGVGQLVREHRDLDAEQRRGHRRAEQRLVALVVGVGDERDARGRSARDGSSR